MQRLIKFSQFRNLGFDKDDYLLLNGDFEKGKMGNLIILIGPNNSGKSNVLNGLFKVCNDGELAKRDITDLSFEEKYRNPYVSLLYKDDKHVFEYKKGLKSTSWRSSGDPIVARPSEETIREELKRLLFVCNSTYGIKVTQLEILVNKVLAKKISGNELYEETMNVLELIHYNIPNNYSYRNVWDYSRNQGNKLIAYYEDAKNGGKYIKEYLKKEIGLDDPIPNCIVYQENPISNSDLVIENVGNLQRYKFFNSLFKAIGVELKTIENTYNQFNQNNNIQYLRKLEKDIQKKIDRLARTFNQLYFESSDQYKFVINFESNRIYFGMARGKDEDPINLEYQSTGFRWFFNLFFNFLSSNELKAGDIVIMDEPATNLHVQGQHELRSFIKEFAISNDILFVLATHSPFLLDIDHYDELRVISTENNRSKIDNRFAAVNLDDSDSLLPIKESLTIKQNVLYDLDTEVYFVEGITDYNYLTMFKKLLDVKNIAFLPFNGVGNNSDKTKKILEKLLKIRFHKRSLLVDADKAGQDMFKQAKDSAFDSVHNLSEIKLSDTKNAMMIEDLFSQDDKKKFPVISDKNSDGTSVMKDHCVLEDFSKTTVDRFKQLFKLLQE